MLAAITRDESGRAAASESIGERLVERLGDVRSAALDYHELLDDDTTTETDLQRHIELNPWLIGLDYARVRPRHSVPRGELDFILERFDGFHDLLELKSPSDEIVEAPDEASGGPPVREWLLADKEPGERPGSGPRLPRHSYKPTSRLSSGSMDSNAHGNLA